MKRIIVWLSILDLLAFFAILIAHGPFAGVNYGRTLGVLYWLDVLLGFALAVYGFAMMIRGGQVWMRHSATCVLLTFIPACYALVGILSKLGAHTV